MFDTTNNTENLSHAHFAEIADAVNSENGSNKKANVTMKIVNNVVFTGYDEIKKTAGVTNNGE